MDTRIRAQQFLGNPFRHGFKDFGPSPVPRESSPPFHLERKGGARKRKRFFRVVQDGPRDLLTGLPASPFMDRQRNVFVFALGPMQSLKQVMGRSGVHHKNEADRRGSGDVECG
mgnify:CR=1 FL=1